MKKFCGAMMVLVLVMAFSACTSSQSGPTSAMGSEPVMYNKYNLHVHYKNSKDVKASYANWTGPYPGHRIVPPGTPMRVQRSARGFLIQRADNGDIINFIYSEQRMNMDKPTYMDKIFSPKKVSLDHLSQLDRDGVKMGKALKGMSRQGVMTALGYPAAHKTPSLDNDKWVYWTNRFGYFAVTFDENDKVIQAGKI